MKTFLALLLLIAPLFASEGATDPSKKNKPPTVKILLAKLEKSAEAQVHGPFSLYNPVDDSWIDHYTRSKKGKLRPGQEGLVWGKTLKGIEAIRIVPDTPHTTLHVNGVHYPGCIEIYSIGGTLNIVNEVGIETYLLSILGPEFDDHVVPQVLDALVITARTSFYALTGKNEYTSWHIDATKGGYLGVNPGKQNRQMEEAIRRTSDMILHYHNKPFRASWGKDHAGTSAPYTSIFRRREKAPSGVASLPSHLTRESSKWQVTFPKKELAKLLSVPSLEQIDLFKTKGSGKVYGAKITSPLGQEKIDLFSLQKALGKRALPSNDFSVRLEKKKWVFTGYGEGSGVGLCLKSAAILAQKGKPLKEILSLHFPQSELVNIRQVTGAESSHSFIWK